MSKNVVAVYSLATNLLRRVIVSDEKIEVVITPGEGFLTVPVQDIEILNDASIRAYVADKVGHPTQNGRCVEVDKNGTVVTVYNADPTIDKTFSEDNIMEYSDYAQVGDIKVNGIFPKPTPIEPKPSNIPLN